MTREPNDCPHCDERILLLQKLFKIPLITCDEQLNIYIFRSFRIKQNIKPFVIILSIDFQKSSSPNIVISQIRKFIDGNRTSNDIAKFFLL